MAINKVVYNNNTLLDLTDTTATASDVAQGKYFYNIAGVRTEGTNQGGSGDGYVWQDAQGYVHLSDEQGTQPTYDTLTVSSSGTFTPSQGHAYNSVIVPSGSATPAATISGTSATVSTGTNTLTLSKTISNTPQVSAGYVNSGTSGNSAVSLTASVNTRSSSDLTVSGATVTAPSGYYSSSASKSVASGSTTPASSISGSSATVTTGTNTLTLSKIVSNTPQVTAGYISSGTSGNTSVSLTASVNTRSSSDLTASTLTVTAPSGYYASNATKTLTDANLTASNIKKDVSIFGVTGTYEGGGASNFAQGIFTPTTSAAGTAQTINVTYSGSGYPVMLAVYPLDGTSGQGMGSLIRRYGILSYYMVKNSYGSSLDVPNYSSGGQNYGYAIARYKSSDTSPTQHSTSVAIDANFFTSSGAGGTSAAATTRFTSNTQLSIFVADTSYGYIPEITYVYNIVYTE